MEPTNISSLQYKLSVPLSGRFYSNSAFLIGVGASLYSSTYMNDRYMSRLYIDTEGVNLSTANSRQIGNTVRCLLQE